VIHSSVRSSGSYNLGYVLWLLRILAIIIFISAVGTLVYMFTMSK
jgi:hypothetical protein